MRHSYDLSDAVIPSGGTQSREISREELRHSDGFVVASPDTLPETVVVKVSLDEGSTFKTLQSSGEDIIIAAGKATVISYMGWDRMLLEAGSAVGADRTFQVQGQEELR